MERRGNERLVVNLKAERLSCSKNCSVFIENLSDTGIYMITAPSKNSEYEPGRNLLIKLELSSGKTLNLECKVKWSYDNSPEDLTNSVGLEILDPPEEYKNFIKTFH